MAQLGHGSVEATMALDISDLSSLRGSPSVSVTVVNLMELVIVRISVCNSELITIHLRQLHPQACKLKNMADVQPVCLRQHWMSLLSYPGHDTQ